MNDTVCQTLQHNAKDEEIFKIHLEFLDLAGTTLSNTQFRVMHFILRRTAKYDKLSDKIPLRHFKSGVVDHKKEEPCIAPLPGNRNTLVKALHDLEKLGFISMKKVGELGTTYITVLKENLKEHIRMAKLRISKKYQSENVEQEKAPKLRSIKVSNPVRNRTDPVRNRTPLPVRNRTPNTTIERPEIKTTRKIALTRDQDDFGVNEEEESNTITRRRRAIDKPSIRATRKDNAATRGPVKEVIARARKTSEDRRTTILTSDEPPITKKAFREVWNASVTQYAKDHDCSGIPSVNEKEAAIFMQSRGSTNPLDKGWKDFIIDCVVNWDDYTYHYTKHFGEYAKTLIPVEPKFGYFLRTWARQFLPHYRERKSGAALRAEQADRARMGKISAAQKRKAEAAQKEIDRLRDQIRRTEYEAETARSHLKAEQSRSTKLGVELIKERSNPARRKLTEEEIEAALDPNNELPTWEELEASRDPKEEARKWHAEQALKKRVAEKIYGGTYND